MQIRTKLGLVDIPNEVIMAAARDIAGSADSTPVIAAPSGSLCTGDLLARLDALATSARAEAEAMKEHVEMCDYLRTLDEDDIGPEINADAAEVYDRMGAASQKTREAISAYLSFANVRNLPRDEQRHE